MARFALLADARKEGIWAFQLVGVLRPPLGGESALEGGLEKRLSKEVDGSLRSPKTLDASIDLVEQRLDPLDDAVLFFEWGQCDRDRDNLSFGDSGEC